MILYQERNGVEAIRVPTIAVIEGVALGGGLEMGLACGMWWLNDCFNAFECDVVKLFLYLFIFHGIGENALMGLPKTGVAIIPGAGGTQRLPRLVGKAIAKDIIFTGRKIDGKEALSMANYKALAIAQDINQKVKVAEKTMIIFLSEEVESSDT
ncbi:hypothetical protein VNO78_26387 [Psophocarpus tetragonolobus]|uniref:Uncharacterized protein n=1 Tax=Psophocarpus tetragonolobus TaxID=3891 RepID=A0AAN9S060_PSOTE